MSDASNENADRVLIVAAAPREVRAVLDGLGAHDAPLPGVWSSVRAGGRFDVLHSGVGKSNSAGATARCLDPRVHRAVLSVGIAGSLPGSGLELGEVVLATRSVFGDEGIGADSGFIPMSEAGFGAFPDGGMHAQHPPEVYGGIEARTGPIATVSWCSGSASCARGVVERTGALCEAMEGASVALAARRIEAGIGTGEVRVISNTTGDRASQRWSLEEALGGLASVLGRLRVAMG